MNIDKEYWKYKKNRKKNKIINIEYPTIKKEYKIAIIVPYRNTTDNVRKMHLDVFYPHMKNFLNGHKYKIFVIEQSNDGKRFNRGFLLNIGIKLATGYDIIITHDVDLLPRPNMLNYYLIKCKYPIHIAWQWKTKYSFNEYFGGIVSFDTKTLEEINGYPNTFWGWGGEDDALYNRIYKVKNKIIRPITGHIEDIEHEGPTKQTINQQKKENILNDLKNWKTDGLNSIKYNIIDKEEDEHYVKITVELLE